MMPSVEFIIFSILVLVTALASVSVRHMLYAVFFQMQAIIAVCGVLTGLNTRFIGFALLSMSLASLLVFLIFSLIVFDVHKKRIKVPKRASQVSFSFFILLIVETIWLFFKSDWPVEKTAVDFSLPVLGDVLYNTYGICVLVFGVLILSAMVGITTLLIDKNAPEEKEETS